MNGLGLLRSSASGRGAEVVNASHTRKAVFSGSEDQSLLNRIDVSSYRYLCS